MARIVPNYSAFRKRNQFDSSLTISVKRAGVEAVLQLWIAMGERSSLPMRIATTESVSLCKRMIS